MPARETSNAGFTLVELLVTLAITAAIVTLSLSGLMLAVRSLEGIHSHGGGPASTAGLSRLRAMISQAMPVSELDLETGLARLMFDGRSTSLEFVTLSEGFAMEGGPVRVRLDCETISEDACALRIAAAVFRPDPQAISFQTPVTVLERIGSFNVRYFGATGPNQPPQWSSQWQGRENIPSAIELRIEPAARQRWQTISLRISIHQGSRKTRTE